jgi:hypothetical protein
MNPNENDLLMNTRVVGRTFRMLPMLNRRLLE